MTSDSAYQETMFQDTVAVVETDDGLLHNVNFASWETSIIL